MKNIKDFILKFINRETIMYIVFGVLTTVVDAVSFYIVNNILKIEYIISTVLAWIFAVLFAFVTNKIFVFKSESRNLKVLIKEISAFVAARLISLGFTLLWMLVCVEMISMDEFISKLLANIFVVIMNYFFSKFFIFKNKQSNTI